MSFEIEVENIKCGGCAASIVKGLQALEGVTSASVDVSVVVWPLRVMRHCGCWLLHACSNWVTRRSAVLKGWLLRRPGQSPLSVVRSVNSVIHLRIEGLWAVCVAARKSQLIVINQYSVFIDNT